MTPIQSDKREFTDSNGRPLENGYIYIGQPDTDPRTNPKTVTFEDSSGAQFTAAQPLRTRGGKIVYNGRPMTALVDGEHSMLVLNSAGGQVEYDASIMPPASGSSSPADSIRVGLTLDAVKEFDVSVGNVVRSVGRNTATDSLGADWLVISSTGSPGDDVDLIDFDNGLQGVRDKSKLYPDSVLPYVADKTFNPDAPAEVWSGSASSVNQSALSDAGAGIYIVVTTAGVTFFMIAQKALSDFSSGQNITGSSNAALGSLGTSPTSFLLTTSALVYRGLTKTFVVEDSNITLSNDSTKFLDFSSSNRTITAIYKV